MRAVFGPGEGLEKRQLPGGESLPLLRQKPLGLLPEKDLRPDRGEGAVDIEHQPEGVLPVDEKKGIDPAVGRMLPPEGTAVGVAIEPGAGLEGDFREIRTGGQTKGEGG
jgi:hypothetical protein